MSHHEEHTHHNKKQRKSDEAQQIMQERTELLDVIREMINVEIERRGVGAGECPHSCKPPPRSKAAQAHIPAMAEGALQEE